MFVLEAAVCAAVIIPSTYIRACHLNNCILHVQRSDSRKRPEREQPFLWVRVRCSETLQQRQFHADSGVSTAAAWPRTQLHISQREKPERTSHSTVWRSSRSCHRRHFLMFAGLVPHHTSSAQTHTPHTRLVELPPTNTCHFVFTGRLPLSGVIISLNSQTSDSSLQLQMETRAEKNGNWIPNNSSPVRG